ncbi:MAG TPA: hydrogenase nickel incorporation protein HypB [Candidatus Binatia bacterium]|nr:hydrogenase nickel incorporation protein HypB [Candidatus Binatia bacterium]
MEIEVGRKILETNDRIADENRRAFDALGAFVVNLMSAPGSGKTSILERTFAALDGELRAAVIEGDVRGSLDADRLGRFGLPIAQINTDPLFGGECHLDAPMVQYALERLPGERFDLVVIENVGNLVCPAEFRVGEDLKVMVLSVAEGDDKPLKYPLMFREATLLLLNKVDLLPHVDFDVARFRANAARVNPRLEIIETSARTREGIDEWIDWLRARMGEAAVGRLSCGET